MRATTNALWLLAVFFAGVFIAPARADDTPVDESAKKDDAPTEAAGDDENDETKLLLKKLTIAMISEVIDERTVVIRDAGAKSSKKIIHLRLGNSGPSPKGSLDDGEHAEKVKVATAALAKLVDKQMVWYKAAPENLQAPSSDDGTPDVVLADLWTIDGKHVSTALKQDGHLAHVGEYEEELAKDILTAAAEIEKKDSYKKLEEALKESEKAKKDAAAAARKEQEQEEEAQNVEGFGLSGWLGLSVVAILVVGVATNFGRPSTKKVNLNRKKGFFEKFWAKLKGA